MTESVTDEARTQVSPLPSCEKNQPCVFGLAIACNQRFDLSNTPKRKSANTSAFGRLPTNYGRPVLAYRKGGNPCWSNSRLTKEAIGLYLWGRPFSLRFDLTVETLVPADSNL